jgi:hypothetical protein
MGSGDSQLIYMILILPGLFGLTLIGEGIIKLTQEEVSGWFHLLMGVVFLMVVAGSYVFMSGMF